MPITSAPLTSHLDHLVGMENALEGGPGELGSEDLPVPVGHGHDSYLGQAPVPVNQPGSHGDVVCLPQVRSQ